MTEGEPARERYLNFLRAGGSVDQIVGPREVCIDKTIPAPVERAIALMSSYVDNLEELAPQARTLMLGSKQSRIP